MNLDNKVRRFKEIADGLVDLYEKKNHNYGDSFGKLYSDLGPIAGLVPLHNKLDRLTNLIKDKDKNHFESIEDNFRDLASYAIMNLIEMSDPKKEYLDFTECTIGDTHTDTATSVSYKVPYKIYAVPKVGVDPFYNDPAKDPFKYLLDDEEANRKFHSDLDKMIEDNEEYSNEH